MYIYVIFFQYILSQGGPLLLLRRPPQPYSAGQNTGHYLITCWEELEAKMLHSTLQITIHKVPVYLYLFAR